MSDYDDFCAAWEEQAHEAAIIAVTENPGYNAGTLLEDLPDSVYTLIHQLLIEYAGDGVSNDKAAGLGWTILLAMDSYARTFDIYQAEKQAWLSDKFDEVKYGRNA